MSNSAPIKEHSHREIMIILSGLMTGMLLAALDQTIVSTALKSIVEDEGAFFTQPCRIIARFSGGRARDDQRAAEGDW